MSYLVCSDTSFPRRRKEMEGRINSFKSECCLASENLTSLVKKAESYLDKLDRNSANYKDCYLHLMRKLDEYIFLIQEYNSGLEKVRLENALDDFAAGSRFSTCSKASMYDGPVRSENECLLPQIADTPRPLFNIDETSSQRGCTQLSDKKKKYQDDLIQLVSNTSLQEPSNYIPQTDNESEPDRSNKENCGFHNIFNGMPLPKQDILEQDAKYSAAITYICEVTDFFIMIDPEQKVDELHDAMGVFYDSNYNVNVLKVGTPLPECFCACRFNSQWCRALILEALEDELQIFYVDIGAEAKVRKNHVQPLPNEFRTLPPFARNCHLTGVTEDSPKGLEVLKRYVGDPVTAIIDGKHNINQHQLFYMPKFYSTSEILEVTLVAEDGLLINQLVVDLERRSPTPNNLCKNGNNYSDPTKLAKSPMRPPLFESSDDEEHEDALMAVQGFIPRDEAENCRFYKGGPPGSTCFKKNCTKKHNNIDPAVTGGWTVDQAAVIADTTDQLQMPSSASTIKVKVTHIAAPNVVFVQFLKDHTPSKRERVFGSNVARNLQELVTLMNVPPPTPRRPPAVRPAIGELVAAPFKDDNYYRAKVIDYDPSRFSLEVFYIDYGNRSFVREIDVFELEPGWEVLPAQAVQCILAGIKPKMDANKLIAARDKLYNLTIDKIFNAFVVESKPSVNEMTINLYNDAGDQITDILVDLDLVDVKTNEILGAYALGQNIFLV